MFDVWFGDIELTSVVLNVSIAVFLPIQLLLCFKVRSKVIRLLPVIVLSGATIFLVAMAAAGSGWDGLGYIFLAIFTCLMLLMCGIGWGIWAIIKLVKKKKDNSKPTGQI